MESSRCVMLYDVGGYVGVRVCVYIGMLSKHDKTKTK